MQIQYIFVHGLSGWGSYDPAYARMPYWGMQNGDLMEYLRGLGYECFAASVSPKGSAWDRACELYAQLTGTRIDYGKVHSEKAGHPRFGKDFSGCPLIPVWDEEHPAVLIGHSFGGATVRLFSHLTAYGEAEEADNTEDCSSFFQGGKGNLIRGIAVLAAPNNGTTAYDLYSDPDFDVSAVKIPPVYRMYAKLMARNGKVVHDRADWDYAAYDMHVDNADALNRKIRMIPDAYYWSCPACITERKNDVSYPKIRECEQLYVQASIRMGAYSGTSLGGIPLGKEWQPNDGLVNTISAKAPSHAPSKEYEPGNVIPGVWNIMPVWPHDHMSFQGGMMRRCDIFPFYRQMMKMMDEILKAGK
ncbi:MAG: hypothetical protein IJ130_01760 [Solobacterium sp.]|nr:hypothetical protein [Solobacterium sp.]